MPRCKNCKEKFKPLRFNQKFCLKAECVREWIEFATKREAKEDRKRIKELKEKLKTVKDYSKDAQKVFNTFIRLRDEGKRCISCDQFLNSSKAKFDAGHYYSQGGHSSVRYDENNVFGQCVECNRYLHGNLIKYGDRLKKLIGEEKYNELKDKAYKTKKWTIDELKEIIQVYKQKVKDLKK